MEKENFEVEELEQRKKEEETMTKGFCLCWESIIEEKAFDFSAKDCPFYKDIEDPFRKAETCLNCFYLKLGEAE